MAKRKIIRRAQQSYHIDKSLELWHLTAMEDEKKGIVKCKAVSQSIIKRQITKEIHFPGDDFKLLKMKHYV